MFYIYYHYYYYSAAAASAVAAAAAPAAAALALNSLWAILVFILHDFTSVKYTRLQNNIHVFSVQKHTGYLWTHYNIPWISYSSNNPVFENKGDYRTLIRVSTGLQHVGEAFYELFTKVCWHVCFSRNTTFIYVCAWMDVMIHFDGCLLLFRWAGPALPYFIRRVGFVI